MIIRTTISVVSALILTVPTVCAQIVYPKTQKTDQTDNYFETEVADPYRWLEDDRSAETENWVIEQNKVTFGYLTQIPFRDALNKRLTSLWNYEKVGSPFKEGDYTYYYKNDGLQNQYVVYRYKTGEDPASSEVFLDPNTFTEDGTTSLGALSFSEDGKQLPTVYPKEAAIGEKSLS